MEKWNDICYIVKAHQLKNSREDLFEIEVVNIFEKLGWSRKRQEIIIRKNIPIGASNSLILDLIINLNNKELFVIELKRPVDQGNDRKSRQLISYMLQSRLKFGLFIGGNLQFFYDVPNDNLDPKKLIEIEFNNDNEEGLRLIELLQKDTFSEEKLIEYCNEKLAIIETEKEKDKIMSFLTSTDGAEYVTNLVKEKLKEDNDKNIIDSIFSNISVSIKSRLGIIKTENSILVPKIKSEFSHSETDDLNEEKIRLEIIKVENRLPKWLRKSKETNINSQIFTRFMQLLDNKDFVSKEALKEICSDISNFDDNLRSMSQFGKRNHGKVFEIHRNEMKLWKPVEIFIRENYKNFEKNRNN